ncbi:MAG TPA: hypothetical protein PKO06_07885, partial [Candidatus Ozemobacteraceae bacterium]|nr:hypothetical protein [Candidatus Ozemobacteraceae bacterium]
GLPNLAFLREALTEGFIPFVDPGRGGGMPFLFDPQTCAWYPPAWIAALFEPATGFRLFQFSHLLWLGLGFALFLHSQTGSRTAAFFAGITAIGAVPHLHALEWMPITAGTAWVPWIFLALAGGRIQLWLTASCLSIYSGHAYLWVMTPVLLIAGYQIVPSEWKKTVRLVLFLVPLIGASILLSYVVMSVEFMSHTVDSSHTIEVTSIAPRHLLGFLSPRSLRDFIFGDRTGRVVQIQQWGAFGWSRQCYLGLLPLILTLISFTRWSPIHRMGICLMAGGILLSMILPNLASVFPDVFRHMHHPASFIQLTVWGLLTLGSCGLASLRRAEPSFPRIAPLVILLLGSCGYVIHQYLAERSLDGFGSPLWMFSFQNSQQAYAFGIAITSLLFLLSCIHQVSYRYLILTALIGFQCADLYENSRQTVPLSIPAAGRPTALTHGLASGSKVLVSPGLQYAVLNIPGQPNPRFMQNAYDFVEQTSVPLIGREHGIHHLADYNPPFQHPGRERWIRHIFTRNPVHRDQLLRLSGVTRVLTDQVQWNVSTPARLFPREYCLPAIYSFDIDNSQTASLVASYSINIFWHANWDKQAIASFPAVDLRWHGATGFLSLPADTTGYTHLYVPVLPLIGWQCHQADRSLSIIRDPDFGIFIEIPPSTSGTLTLSYRPEIWFHVFLPFLLAPILLLSQFRAATPANEPEQTSSTTNNPASSNARKKNPPGSEPGGLCSNESKLT